ncbi:acyltransferase family protein [Photobacterium leiognathi]|uniref:acyltransferase family protein n=1 Tax=Photobacterium leiognathi TaxID=553611 RepID=UPI002980A914|nr:acyltransferase [Photobacterium leiognathi]
MEWGIKLWLYVCMIAKNYNETNFITGLRGIAAFMVFFIHSGGGGIRNISGYFNDLVDIGKYGVSIFFVISGFTIFYQIFNANYKFVSFLSLRILRIGLAYYPILLSVFFLAYFDIYNLTSSYWLTETNSKIDLINLFMHLSFLGMFDIKFANNILGVEWSLYVEVFFYIIMGCFLTRKTKKYIWLCAVICMLFSGLFILFRLMHITSNLQFVFFPFIYGPLFLLGGLAFHVKYNVKLNINKKKYSDASIMLFLACILITPFIKQYLLVSILFGVATFLVIAFGCDSKLINLLLNNKFFSSIGKISFSFYLIHCLIIQIVSAYIPFGYELFIVSFVMTMLFSTVYASYFEYKLYIKLKDSIRRFNYA